MSDPPSSSDPRWKPSPTHLQVLASDSDVKNGARSIKRHWIKAVVGVSAFLASFVAAMVITEIIHLGIALGHSLGWGEPSWLEWADHEGVGGFFVSAVILGTILYVVEGRKMVAGEDEGTPVGADTVTKDEVSSNG